jgi:cytoplasmic iron level regulating protein YaaA (DUF328/UPF0246 family)
MKVLISPAKSLNFDKVDESNFTTTVPSYPKESRQLINKLKRTSKKQLRALMAISKDLADLNMSRYESFSDEFTTENSKPAILAFNGDVYVGMEAYKFNSNELKFANDHIRILSGLYGLLKPLDRIQPYRLEMGTRLKVGRKNNLVNFWKEKLTKHLNEELFSSGENAVINLASKEYFNALDAKKINANIINCSFKEDHGGQLKFISFNAKKARGMMCKFIIEHKITDPELIKGFDLDGYHYESTLSDANNLMFIR